MDVGRGDGVQCFYCDGGLKNWDPEDVPWVEHARFFGNCAYLLLKQGKTFVDMAKNSGSSQRETLAQFEDMRSRARRWVSHAIHRIVELN